MAVGFPLWATDHGMERGSATSLPWSVGPGMGTPALTAGPLASRQRTLAAEEQLAAP